MPSKTSKKKSTSKRTSKTSKKKTGSKKTKRPIRGATTGRILYFGIGPRPQNRAYASSEASLNNRQVRRYGEYEVPHKQMAVYLKERGLPPARYKRKAPIKKHSGSKTAKKTKK